MREAIRLSIENVKNGGGPFGAVIVKDDKIIATGVNRVTANHDPTAHAEVNPEKNDMVQIHDALEAAEVEIARHMPVRLLLHCDPFFSQDPELKRWRTLAEDLIGALDPELKLYDFRLEKSEEHILLNFQLLVPRKFFLSNAELIERITGQLREHDRKVDTKIQITHSFV